jgi:hypothetical protein
VELGFSTLIEGYLIGATIPITVDLNAKQRAITVEFPLVGLPIAVIVEASHLFGRTTQHGGNQHTSEHDEESPPSTPVSRIRHTDDNLR